MNKVKKALISVYDKKNLKSILNTLDKHNFKILSSGGTFKKIKKLGFECTEISTFTGSPEILDGRVKTLHPKIYAGILSKRNNSSHNKDLENLGFEKIDLIIVNFYPFEEIIKKTKSQKKIIENIDIGGPSMARAAAKNFEDVTVITNVHQYDNLITELNQNKGLTTFNFRRKMSEEAFSETSYYDSLIANYFTSFSNNKFPQKKLIYADLIDKLRYGENPHQEGAIYSTDKKFNIQQLSGKPLSYNNYNDIFSAITISKSLPKNKGTVIIKHSNPCGVSINSNKLKSYKLALACDPVSAFGGIVCCNFKIDKKLATELNKIYFEVVIANGFHNDAIKILKNKRNLRIIDTYNLKLQNIQNSVSYFNSILMQTPDEMKFSFKNFKVVSKIKPNLKTLKSLIFAFNVCRFVKSNAVVLAKNDSIVGIGGGQPSRLDSCNIAIEKMNKFKKNNNGEEIVAASDAFFPFVDGIEVLVQAGVSAVIQPAGSIRDKEIIKFANQTGTILVFSNTRHFRH